MELENGDSTGSVRLETYRNEEQLPLIQSLIEKDLSEPYSIFTYRYFINQWPHLCLLAMDGQDCVGTIVCKMERTKHGILSGYIAMLAVRKERRRAGLATMLVVKIIDTMIQGGCEEVTLEAEVTNRAALKLYENLGFIRDTRLEKYYLNGSDAFRLKLRLQAVPPMLGLCDVAS